MQEVSRSGRTIVFVSHQINQIRRLCERVIWIDAGRIRETGPTGEVVAKYESASLGPNDGSFGDGRCFLSWSICGHDNVVRDGLRDVTFHFHIRVGEPVSQGHFGMAVLSDSGAVLVGWGFDNLEIGEGEREISVRVPGLPLRPGAYSILCSLFNRGNNLTGGQLIEQWFAQPPLVVDTPPLSHPQDRWAGVLNLPADIEIRAA